MAIFVLIRLGNPVLRKKSQFVPRAKIKTKSFQKFLNKLAKTCLKNKGVGIAAPQIGKNIRVDPKKPRYINKNPFPLTISINPKIVKRSKQKKEDW